MYHIWYILQPFERNDVFYIIYYEINSAFYNQYVIGNFAEFTMFSPDDELTPGQAADLLNVSRSYLDRRLEQGDIPARNRGGQCRLRLITEPERVLGLQLPPPNPHLSQKA